MVEGEKVEKENEQLKTGERARERATKDLTWESEKCVGQRREERGADRPAKKKHIMGQQRGVQR